MNTVMIVGLGDLGGWALELLARADGVDRLVTLRRTAGEAISRTHLAAIGSTFQGHAKRFEEIHHDLRDVEGMARLLEAVRPDVILHTASLQSPRVLTRAEVTEATRERLRRARFAMWLPWHLLPATWLVEALLRADLRPPVVNLAFPDVVNPALWKRFGWGPVAGGGNIEIAAAAIHRFVCADHGVPPEEAQLSLIASHAFFTLGPRADIPHFLRIEVQGHDVTATYRADTLMDEQVGRGWHAVDVSSPFAASAAKNVIGILHDTAMRTHVTAPNGLPGGYPALLGRERIEISLPNELTLEAAIAINVAGNAADGIAAIEPDGTVVYTDDATSAMQELGYECEEVTFDSLSMRAERLRDVFRRIAGP